jgi:hypothetical protein
MFTTVDKVSSGLALIDAEAVLSITESYSYLAGKLLAAKTQADIGH